MRERYYAIVAEDHTGPAYGTGTSEAEARLDATQWGFSETDGVCVEITAESYRRVQDGSPEAWDASE